MKNWKDGNRKGRLMGTERCLLCGEPIPEGTQICPLCMGKYTETEEDAQAAEELRDIADVLSITANTDGNIRRCMEAVLRIADRLERKKKNESIQTEDCEGKATHKERKWRKKGINGK